MRPIALALFSMIAVSLILMNGCAPKDSFNAPESPSSAIASEALPPAVEPPEPVKLSEESARAADAVIPLLRLQNPEFISTNGYRMNTTVLGNGYTVVEILPRHVYGIYLYDDKTGTAEQMNIDTSLVALSFASDSENRNLVKFASSSGERYISPAVTFKALPSSLVTYTYNPKSKTTESIYRNMLSLPSTKLELGYNAEELLFGDLSGDDKGITVNFKPAVEAPAQSATDDETSLHFPLIRTYINPGNSLNTVCFEFEHVRHDESVQKKFELLKNLKFVKSVKISPFEDTKVYDTQDSWGTVVQIEFEPNAQCHIEFPPNPDTGMPMFRLVFSSEL